MPLVVDYAPFFSFNHSSHGMIANERKSILSLAMLYATRMLGLFMVLPVFVLYGSDLEGATPALIGLAIGAYGLSQALLQIPFGALSDRYGRKLMLYIGLSIFFAGSVIAATSESIYGVIAGRFIQGAGAIAAVIMALLSDLTSVESRTKAMAFVGMSIGMSFTLALILGPIIAEVGGLKAIFWLTAALALFALLWSMVAIPKPRVRTKHRDSRVFSDQIRDVLRDSELLRLDFGIFVLHLVLTAMFIAIPVSLVNHAGLPSEDHWWLYLLVLVGSFFCMVPLIIVGEKMHKMKLIFCLAIFMLLVAAAFMVYVQADLTWFVVGLFVFFMGFNLLEASLPSLVSKISPAGSKGTAMGVYSTGQFLGAFIGGVLGGGLLELYSETAIYLFAAVLIGVWLVVALTMANPKHEKTMTIFFRNNLEEQEVDLLSDQLVRVEGVEDAVVVSDGVAYLKVLSGRLDEQALQQLKHQYS
jgi:MFS family permease